MTALTPDANRWRHLPSYIVDATGTPAPAADSANDVAAAFRSVDMVFQGSSAATVALRGLDLEIHRNELLVLMGPSGCGKTTSLNLLAGHEQPTSGQVMFEGEPVSHPGRERAVVFQHDALFPWLTVEENALFGLRAKELQENHGVRRLLAELGALNPLPGLARDALRRVGRQPRAGLRGFQDWFSGHLITKLIGSFVGDNMNASPGAGPEGRDWVSVVGLDGFRHSLPKELSGGMRKRVELARAYAAQPRLLLLDEPFASLDALTREEMQAILERLWQGTRCTVVFVTHDWREATAVADRIVMLTSRPGRVHSIIPVDLPRPRDASVRRSSEFIDLAEHVGDTVRELARPALFSPSCAEGGGDE